MKTTPQRLLLAAQKLFEEGGLPALGVNAIARKAGVDKVLIYRNFGGLDPLIKRLSETLRTWPTLSQLFGRNLREIISLKRKERLRAYCKGLAAAIEKDAVVRNAFLAELGTSNPICQRSDPLRQSQLADLLELLGGDSLSPSGDFTKATPHRVIMMSAGVALLALLKGHQARFYGLELDDEKTWLALMNSAAEMISEP